MKVLSYENTKVRKYESTKVLSKVQVVRCTFVRKYFRSYSTCSTKVFSPLPKVYRNSCQYLLQLLYVAMQLYSCTRTRTVCVVVYSCVRKYESTFEGTFAYFRTLVRRYFRALQITLILALALPQLASQLARYPSDIPTTNVLSWIGNTRTVDSQILPSGSTFVRNKVRKFEGTRTEVRKYFLQSTFVRKYYFGSTTLYFRTTLNTCSCTFVLSKIIRYLRIFVRKYESTFESTFVRKYFRISVHVQLYTDFLVQHSYGSTIVSISVLPYVVLLTLHVRVHVYTQPYVVCTKVSIFEVRKQNTFVLCTLGTLQSHCSIVLKVLSYYQGLRVTRCTTYSTVPSTCQIGR